MNVAGAVRGKRGVGGAGMQLLAPRAWARVMQRTGAAAGSSHTLPLRATVTSQASASKTEPDACTRADRASEPATGTSEVRPPALALDPRAEMEADDVEHLHEGVLWFSNLFPARVSRWDFRPTFYAKKDVTKTLDKLIDKMHSKHDITIHQCVLFVRGAETMREGRRSRSRKG